MSTSASELGHSPDLQAQRQEELLTLIRQIAPDIISDNQIDIERLKVLLGQEAIAPNEHYELSWAGKSAARREIQKNTSYTLQPAANNPAQASHMLIEGENLEVLRVLQKSYYSKVKMIYIDPPYNTGNDSFVYPDDYSETLDEYLKRTGAKSEAGFLNKQNLWKKNSKESGQYHSAWLSMMYPRLYLARNLLRDDGVIFISIDDNEAANLKLLCDEVFGAENFVAQFVHKNNSSKNQAKLVSVSTEYLFCFAKNSQRIKNIQWRIRKKGVAEISKTFQDLKLKGFSNSEILEEIREMYKRPKFAHLSRWNKVDDRGVFKDADLSREGGPRDYTIVNPNTGSDCVIPSRGWGKSLAELKRLQAENLIWYGDGDTPPGEKDYINPDDVSVPDNFWYFDNSVDTREIKSAFGRLVFENPKPLEMIKQVLALHTSGQDIVFDFFAGSGTTAKAVIELNIDDSGERQCISIQIPEETEENSEAYKAGYRTIADITRARINNVIAKLKSEHPEKTTDLACANFKLAPSNFKTWRTDLTDVKALREQLHLFQSAEKRSNVWQDSQNQTAMLTELLLKHGLGVLGVHAISKPKTLAGVTVHRVLLKDDKHLWLCFEPYSEAIKNEIVNGKPDQVILLNSCFVGDKADEQISNLQLELAGLDIGLLVI